MITSSSYNSPEMVALYRKQLEVVERTEDEKGLTHSYNDQPLSFYKRLTWYSHGERHRGGDKPAIIDFSFSKGLIYEWAILGLRHCSTGPAIVNEVTEHKSYFLFAQEVDIQQFNRVRKIVEDESVPLWVAWLRDNGHVTFEMAEPFAVGNSWEELPVEWLLRSWDVTAHSMAGLNDGLNVTHSTKRAEDSWRKFIKITQFLHNPSAFS